MRSCTRTTALFTATIGVLLVIVIWEKLDSATAVSVNREPRPSDSSARLGNVRRYGAIGDGKHDDTAAVQKAVNSQCGGVVFPRGVYRITKTIVVDLDRVGPTSIVGDGTATIVMAGAGPAFRFIGTHDGTAAPKTVKPNVWMRQRTPMVDAVEIVGDHPEACGVEVSGTMQMTISRLVVRKALHGVHLVNRNRNVILSECHIYENRGIGVFLDRLNLHQVNISNCHISYNAGGGIVLRKSEVRNLQIGTCDIEGNMGGPKSEPTANVLLDSTGSSIGEVTIVGCTIQHSHDAPHSANIRINGGSTPRRFTKETRHGNITIADNVLSDVRVNIEIRNTRGVTISGNTMWRGYDRDLHIENCANVIVANNVFDRNPRYHYGDGGESKHGVLVLNSTDCTINANHINGTGNVAAAMIFKNCRRCNITNCTILDYKVGGLLLENVTDSRVSDCLIRNDVPLPPGTKPPFAIRKINCSRNMLVDNLTDDTGR